MTRLACLAAIAAALAAPALAQERPLTDAEVLDLAQRQAVWCENWSEETRDCESLYMLRQEADGSLTSAGMFLLTERPEIRFMIAETVRLENGRLCSSGSTDELNVQATRDGAPSAQDTLMVRMLLAESMADFADATICLQLVSTGDPEVLGEIITADDLRLYDFESTYRLGTVDSGFLLRPMIDDRQDEGQTAL